MNIIPYGRQEITSTDIESVLSTLRSDYLTQGPAIYEFEKNFAICVGAKYAVAVNNGTAALHLAYLGSGIVNGSRVVTTPLTFAATANAALYCGADVVFCDIDPKTMLIDIEKLEEILKVENIDLITIVSFAGYPIEHRKLSEIAKKYGCKIIEDACHSPGSSRVYENEIVRTGSCDYVDVTVFSFHPVKHIACGEGGMITTNCEDVYEKLCLLRTHGISNKELKFKTNNDGLWYHEQHELGYNYRMPDILAALGNSQLMRLRSSIQKRNEIAVIYDKHLRDLPLTVPYRENSIEHAFHLYVIRTERRKELYEYLRSNKIFAQVHYLPVYLHPYYREKYGCLKGQFPVVEKFYDECLSLPMFPTLSSIDQQYVISKIIEFCN